MFGQMVTPREGFHAEFARKLFLSGVGSPMPSQFVGASEFFNAARLFANERLDSFMTTNVSFQMGSLAVLFPARITDVLPWSFAIFRPWN